ncbi:retinoic acid receptor responder protein 3-like [Durio zibethinus]|uniref:Retinoic acid receptor responder protein 3-like n=1 Tax=Durio zibethinus TaxID=66656 RepID=A0A6P5WVB3_DURZI|nr:retinoic acid receptor responder protein 3-like [Durio zibethinus]
MGQSKSSLQPGDHIYCDRSGSSLYNHHGIYVGDGMVIHLMPPSKTKHRGSSAPCPKCGYKPDIITRVIKTCLDCFCDGHSVYVKSHCCSKAADEVVKTATDFLERNDFGPYRLLKRNCEHFAVYCKTGSATSPELVTKIGVPLGVGVPLLIATGPVGAVGFVAGYAIAKVITDAT